MRHLIPKLFIVALLNVVLVHPGYAAATTCSPPQPTGSVSVTEGNNCQLSAGATPLTAVFVYADAAYNSVLSLPSDGYSDIFQNHVNSLGDLMTLNVTIGQNLDFTLSNNSGTFTAGDNSADGVYHAAYRDYAHYSDFNDGALDPAVLAILNANGGVSNYTFVAFEDQFGGGDLDFNDLVFAFDNTLGVLPTPPTGVPEPVSLLLLACGLAGMAAVRYGDGRYARWGGNAVTS